MIINAHTKVMVSSDEKSSKKVWNLETGQEFAAFETQSSFNKIAVKQGKILLVYANRGDFFKNNSINLWDYNTQIEIRNFKKNKRIRSANKPRWTVLKRLSTF